MGHSQAVKLIAFIKQIKLKTINTSLFYGLKNFLVDLKETMQFAVLENQNIILLIEDFNIIKEEFLQYINSIVVSGNVPGLYSIQEFEQIIPQLQKLAIEESFEDDLQSYFFYSNFF